MRDPGYFKVTHTKKSMKKITLFVLALLVGVLAYAGQVQYQKLTMSNVKPIDTPTQIMYPKIVFAGGCFWCTEAEFNHLPGVISAVSGFTGGKVVNPSYVQVSSGRDRKSVV